MSYRGTAFPRVMRDPPSGLTACVPRRRGFAAGLCRGEILTLRTIQTPAPPTLRNRGPAPAPVATRDGVKSRTVVPSEMLRRRCATGARPCGLRHYPVSLDHDNCHDLTSQGCCAGWVRARSRDSPRAKSRVEQGAVRVRCRLLAQVRAGHRGGAGIERGRLAQGQANRPGSSKINVQLCFAKG